MSTVAFNFDLGTEEGRAELKKLVDALGDADEATRKFDDSTGKAERAMDGAEDSAEKYGDAIARIDEVMATAAVAGIAAVTAAVIGATAKFWEKTQMMRDQSKEYKAYQKELTNAERSLNRIIAASGAFEALLKPITELIREQEKALRDDSVKAQQLALDIADGLVLALEVLIQAGGFTVDTLYAADAAFIVVSNSVSIFFELIELVGRAVMHFTNEVMMGLLTVLDGFGENVEVLSRAIGADGLADSINDARQSARDLERQIQEWDTANLQAAGDSMERIDKHTENSADALIQYRKDSEAVQATMKAWTDITDKMRDNLARARGEVRPLGKRFGAMGKEIKAASDEAAAAAAPGGPFALMASLLENAATDAAKLAEVDFADDEAAWEDWITRFETLGETIEGALTGYDTPFGEIVGGLGEVSNEVMRATALYGELRAEGMGAGEALRASAAASLGAVGAATAAQIEDTRKAAAVRGAFAVAESALYFATGNIPQGAAAAAAATLHFAVAATSKPSGGGAGASGGASSSTVQTIDRGDTDQAARRQAQYIADAIAGDSGGAGGLTIVQDFSSATLLEESPAVAARIADAARGALELQGITLGGE